MTSAQASITAKYARLLEAIKRLESIRSTYSREQFVSSPEVHDAAIYNVVIGVEAITDIGNHVLARRFQDYSEHYKDIIKKMGKYHIVSTTLTARTKKMAAFRNLAIHVYEGLSLETVYDDILKHAPDDFRAYAKALHKHVFDQTEEK